MFMQDLFKEGIMSQKSFFDIAEEIRKAKHMRVMDFVRAAGISPQLRYHWRGPGTCPSMEMVKRMERNLHVKFLIGEDGRPYAWENDFVKSDTPASVRGMVQATVDGTYQSLAEQLRQLFGAVREGMDAQDRKKLEAEYDNILYEMESTVITANHQLTMLFRKAQKTIKEYLTKEEAEVETYNHLS